LPDFGTTAIGHPRHARNEAKKAKGDVL
jgi:hypothetical protein